MKKILIIGLFTLLGLQACKKDQTLVDDKKPEDRNRESLEMYKKTLTANTNGWKAVLYTNDVGGSYSFYLSFKENDRVVMQADYDEDTAGDPLESSYDVKQGMVPSLIFDTYNYLHLLSDPNPGEFGGNLGSGYGSDFEFEIRAQVGDTLKLEGKKRLTRLVLVKATAAEKTFYTTAAFSSLVKDFNAYLKANSFLYIPDAKDNSKRIQVSVATDIDVRAFALSALENNETLSAQTTYGFSTSGIVFTKPLIFSGRTFVAVDWDAATSKLFLIPSSGPKIEVLVSATPILPLHLLMGTNYNAIILPGVATYPGWSNDFVARRAAAAAGVATFSVSGARLSLDRMSFTFNSTLKTMNVVAITPYGTSSLTLTYPYSYAKTPEGIYKFTAGTATGNSAALGASFNPILLQRMNVDTFTLDYFVNPANGQILGQFKSVEHPDFIFSGILQ